MVSTNYSLQPLKAVVQNISEHKFWHLNDVRWMTQALELAKIGASKGEVPVGAILVRDNQSIGRGFNEPIGRCDATAHAEIVALRSACLHLQNYRLPPHTTLYVTLEPCTMCIGALIHARVDRLIYAASEPRAGMVGSQMNLSEQPFYNHRIQTLSGLHETQSSELLKRFFRARRQASKELKRR
ncbi:MULTISPECIES: tRNA adenosine(34) deaminase TadA [unclassified Psychrobacter]|uniref:tRNA adenosine(34) deaminase TadA n=1 Tax=unclassified Psychrobacter TaxID=196806 RepID=UPI003FD0FA3C